MISFGEKKPNKRERFWLGFPDILAAGLAITDQDVTAEVYENSDVKDGVETDILDGNAVLNTQAITIDGEVIPIGGAIGIWVKDNTTQGATYVLTFTPTTSEGGTPGRDALLPITKYVPK